MCEIIFLEENPRRIAWNICEMTRFCRKSTTRDLLIFSWQRGSWVWAMLGIPGSLDGWSMVAFVLFCVCDSSEFIRWWALRHLTVRCFPSVSSRYGNGGYCLFKLFTWMFGEAIICGRYVRSLMKMMSSKVLKDAWLILGMTPNRKNWKPPNKQSKNTPCALRFEEVIFQKVLGAARRKWDDSKASECTDQRCRGSYLVVVEGWIMWSICLGSWVDRGMMNGFFDEMEVAYNKLNWQFDMDFLSRHLVLNRDLPRFEMVDVPSREDIRVLEDLRWWFAASPSCCRSFSDSYWNTFDIFWSHLTSKTREESGRKQIGTNMRTWRIFKLFRSWTVQEGGGYQISWYFSTPPKITPKKTKNTRLRTPRGCHGIHGNEQLWIFMGSESSDDFPLVSLFEDSVVNLKAAPKTLASADGWKVGGGFGMKIWYDICIYIHIIYICTYIFCIYIYSTTIWLWMF